jgi:site-specific recombinase
MERLCATQTNAKQIPEMKKTRVCFIRMDGALVDALRVVEITTVARTKDEALQRLTRAIDHWIQKSDEGGKACAESSEDFNVGDLAGYLDQCGKAVPSLQHYLDLEGIARIKDQFVLTNSEQESYDRILELAA